MTNASPLLTTPFDEHSSAEEVLATSISPPAARS
jgi:hypothetical protein